VLPFGRLVLIWPSVPIVLLVLRPAGSVLVRFDAPPVRRSNRYVVVRPSAVGIGTV
jgi:hypothetical protein